MKRISTNCRNHRGDRRSSRAAYILLTSTVLLISACSSGGVPSENAGATITVGSQGGFPPIEFTLPGEEEMTGVSAELLREAAKRLDRTIEFVKSDYSGLIPGLQSRRWNMSSGGMTDQPEREKVVDFINYLKGGATVVLRKGEHSDWNSLSDLCGATVAVLAGSTPFSEPVKATSDECVANGRKPIKIDELDSTPNTRLQLDNGRVEAFLSDYVSSSYLVKETPEKYALMTFENGETRYTTHYLSWGVDKSERKLRDDMTEALQGMVDDGSYQKILDNWGLGTVALDSITNNFWKE